MKPWSRVKLQGQAITKKAILADEALLFQQPQPEPCILGSGRESYTVRPYSRVSGRAVYTVS